MFSIRCIKKEGQYNSFVIGDIYTGWLDSDSKWNITVVTARLDVGKNYTLVLHTKAPEDHFEIVDKYDDTEHKLICVKSYNGVSEGEVLQGYKFLVEYHIGDGVEERLSWVVDVYGKTKAFDLDCFITVEENRDNIIEGLV